MEESRIREFLLEDYQRVLSTVALIVQDHAMAEEAVQEAVARAWEQLDRGADLYSLTGWVMRVAINLGRSSRRRRAAEGRARDRMAAMRTEIELPDDAIAVAQALQALTRREREVAVLRYYLEYSVAEIAETLDVADGTVKALLFRARRTMTDQLRRPDEEVSRLAES